MECPRCGENLRLSTVTKHPDRNDIDVRSCGGCCQVVEYISRSIREYVYDESEKPRPMRNERFEPKRKYEYER
jgi:transcription elongation factor Elf1